MDRMDRSVAEMLLETMPALYSAAQKKDVNGVTAAMRRLLARLRKLDPALARELRERLPGRPPPAAAAALPLDPDTRTGLLRQIDVASTTRPVLSARQDAQLKTLLAEHQQLEALARMGLHPRSSLFLVGPPGVGKTSAAAWLASQLGAPLFQIEIPSLISSFLGKTGRNLREVFDFARGNRVVLLLDEFDAIAKRRDDDGDLGEIRRIVSVLLKEIEEWPGPSVLVAATNHPELIDPAVFRRFQLTVTVGLPGPAEALEILSLHLKPLQLPTSLAPLASRLLSGKSGSDIRNVALEARRTMALDPKVRVEVALLKALSGRAHSAAERRNVARAARSSLEGQVDASELADWLGVSKGTLSGYLGDA